MSRNLSRRQLLLGAGAAAAFVTVESSIASGQAFPAHLERSCCPVRPAPASGALVVTLKDAMDGNERAMAIARSSSLVSRAKEELYAFAQGIDDDTTRRETISLLDLPAPTYQLRSPTNSDKRQVRQDLLDAGLIPEATTVEGIFPPVADATQPAQPIWSAPGGAYGGHHSYPGGLLIHEWVNAGLAKAFGGVYEAAYGLVSGPAAINTSVSLAAPLWHDVHKTVVMQWNQDGSELAEQIIADTGAHHPLSGAEAIVRGMSSDFVVALLSAHNAATTVKETVTSATPILTGYQRLVNYVRAAAIIARVDPVGTGLLSRTSDGTTILNQDPPRFEGFINHLADQDYVLTGDTAGLMIKILQQIAGEFGIDVTNQIARFNLFRNLVFSQVTDMRLYGAQVLGGVEAVKGMIAAEVDLSQLGS